MPSKKHIEEQFEELLTRKVLASSLMGTRTKTWKERSTEEELVDTAAPAVIKPTALGKRVRERGSAGDSGVD